ncbi:MAG: glutamate-5-semialdehyde dehydrogenase [Gluconacetobacter diazotrophicus]|nr:glutamate-5-semialdehyde dehydrogenase [Gluconacetobacter diazotrophicus]
MPGNAEVRGDGDWVTEAGRRARLAARALAASGTDARERALRAAAAAIRDRGEAIAAANREDVAAAAKRLSGAFLDRLVLTPERIEAMARGVEEVAALPDPVGRVLAEWDRPNGLRFRRVACPIGVIGMIYESRPNVGADAAALCVKSGSAVILRGGSESLNSARAIHAAMVAGVEAAGLPADCVQNAPDADRAHVAALLAASGLVDLLIPRGGKSLVERVQREARVPVLAHAEGLCHTYVHRAADPAMARAIVGNAKMRRTGICGATETLLIDADCAPALLPGIVAELGRLGCSFRADARARAILPALPAAQPGDFDTEWLDAVLSVAVVDGVGEAVAHVNRHGSGHTDCIVTEDAEAAQAFLAGTDGAVAMWNASTQFCDGGEFGFGAEIGISTGRVHARGPVGPEQLCCFRTLVVGTGQLRP